MSEPQVFERVDAQIEQENKFSKQQKKEFKEFVREYYTELQFEKDDIRLDRFSVENFRTIDKAEIEFNRADTILYGRNSKGKTSLIKALLYNIAGLPENSSAFDMTNLVKTDRTTSSTTGFWTIDDSPMTLERALRQKGQGNSLSGDEEPYLSESHTQEATLSAEFTDPSRVLETFGLQSLKQRGHDPYSVLSLFFLMSEDFTRFLGESHSELIDLLFGINITAVISAIENKIDELELEKIEDESAQRRVRYSDQEDEIQEELRTVRSNLEEKLDELKQKEDRLNNLKDALEDENQLNKLKSQRNEQKGRLADLKTERSEVVEELASIRRTIERYQDTELVDDMSGIADELRNFMTIPDRCPICTNKVDTDQREAMLHDHACPLCRKEMPDDRYRTEVEYADPEEATERDSTHHEGSLDEYREDERRLVAKRERLDNKIESLEAGIEELTQDIEQSDLSDLADKRDELQREVRDLRDATVELQIREETLSQQLTRVTYERKAYGHFVDIAKEKNSRREAFSRLKGIVERARTRRREKIKSRIGEEIQSLFDYFTEGTLRDAHSIEFKSGGSYHFEITTSTDMLDSSVADESTAEINLHSLLFHTAILKLLSQSIEAPPLKLFVIDSPFANEVDERNAGDIVDFISALPDILPDYQIILASAETGDFNPEQYADSYNLEEFS
ncbi:AAA family ATPase [Halorubrum ezzemoulense]|uniref:AAA family ATPase n=1 Tax=Halorubrum ezzemoulense TaxID=337243 RepID=UPI00232C6878|nr:AAA family ATPase [Halorubrum ezzemoulense]MDB2262253.1 AAA family ATPase [Halorubrum ezzemoulense]MDB2269094.1 AAA family ATPase [Halorubrum ezzemoulense]